MKSPGFNGSGLSRPEDLSFVRVPGAAQDDDVALVGVVVRTAHDAGREVVDRQVVARLRWVAFDDGRLDAQRVAFGRPPRQLVELDADERPFGIPRRQRNRVRRQTTGAAAGAGLAAVSAGAAFDGGAPPQPASDSANRHHAAHFSWTRLIDLIVSPVRTCAPDTGSRSSRAGTSADLLSRRCWPGGMSAEERRRRRPPALRTPAGLRCCSGSCRA